MFSSSRLRRLGVGHLAVVIASAALFVSLDGPTQAAGLITGKQIKNSSITGKDVKDDKLTGADIAESSLGKVSTAVSADTAKGVVANSVTGAGITDKSLSLADYATARGSTSIDYSNILAHTCQTDLIETGLDDLSGALWVVTLNDKITDFANLGLTFHTTRSSVPGNIRVNACNITNAARDPGPASFEWAVLR